MKGEETSSSCLRVSFTMMRFKKILYGIFLFDLLLFCHSEDKQGLGDNCTLTSGEFGTCKLFSDCPSAYENVNKGLRPVTCGFDGIMPIVCCMKSETVTTTEALPVKENLAKNPGDISSFWCNKYLELCKSNRKRRDVSQTEVPDYEEFGTTEIPSIETVTTEAPIIVIGPVEGGVNTEMDEFPHMAAIGYGESNNIRWLCGGSLISENFVLTAAHCLHSPTHGAAQWIRLGAYLLKDELRSSSTDATIGQTHRVVKRIRHPEYRPPSKYHDVALIEIGPTLESTFRSTMSKELHPACLNVEMEINATKAIATGWGRLGFNEDVSAWLQKVELDVLDREICNKTYDYEIRLSSALKRGIDETVVCAGVLAGGKDTCLGDSGGPLQILMGPGTCSYKILAITSFGKACGFTNTPAVYMNVAHYIPWIESHVWPDS